MERRIINPWTWQEAFGFVHANEISGSQRALYCAGQTSMDDDGNPMHPGDMGAQVARALDNLEMVLAEAGLGLADVVRLNYYVTEVDRFLDTNGAAAERLSAAGCRPTGTLLDVARLGFPELMVEIETTAVA